MRKTTQSVTDRKEAESVRDCESELLRLQLENQLLRSELDRFRLLTETYANLPRLHRVLGWIALDAYPLKSQANEYGVRIRGTGTPTPGAGTHTERNRQKNASRDLGRLTEKFERWVSDGDDPAGPRCRRRACPRNGRRQPFGSKFCVECGGALSSPEEQDS